MNIEVLLNQKRDMLVADIFQSICLQDDGRWQPTSEAGAAKYREDINYHLAYLADAIVAHDPTLFGDYIVWVQELFAGLNFAPDALSMTQKNISAVLQRHCDPAAWLEIQPYLAEANTRLNLPQINQSTFIDESIYYGALSREFLNLLLAGDRRKASQFILDIVEDAASVQDIYLSVFQPVLYEIGRLWQVNKITVGEEHFITAAIQFIMSQLYGNLSTTPRNGRKLVATSVSGELHEVGIRMVTDIFEIHGWDTIYLGANVPYKSVVHALIKHQADILAISATITFHIHKVIELIELVRSNPQTKHIPILVGGRPFNISPDLWQQVGADGYAPDPISSIQQANHLVAASS